MVFAYTRENSLNWGVGDNITAERLEDFNEDLTNLFKRLDDRNLSFTYDSEGQLTQIVDNNNTITVNVSWVDWGSDKLYIQEAGDPKKFTITYGTVGPVTCVYA